MRNRPCPLSNQVIGFHVFWRRQTQFHLQQGCEAVFSKSDIFGSREHVENDGGWQSPENVIGYQSAITQ